MSQCEATSRSRGERCRHPATHGKLCAKHSIHGHIPLLGEAEQVSDEQRARAARVMEEP